MEAGLAAELGQRICTTALLSVWRFSDPNASKFLNEIKQGTLVLTGGDVVPVQTQEAERHRACRHVQHDLLVVGEPGPANVTVRP